ncbi:MAG: tRNA pseudouridine(13) synthase TruD [Planctomycetota bacterium]
MTSDIESLDTPLPYLTADLPGIGGELKQEPGDFEVEEIPAYVPVGAGEHLYLWIEKTGITTEQLTRQIVQTLRVASRDIGVAALKDRHAVARQFVSIPAKFADKVELLESPQVRVLSAALHGNKLRTGHLKGNRFSILLRNVGPQALELAQPIVARLQQLGVPNYFGDQRFGIDGETAQLGFDLLKGEQTPDDIHPARRRFLLKLALSSAQSVLFNQALAARLLAGQLHQVLLGDVLQVAASGGVFVCEDVAADQPRFDSREVLPTGPMFGPKMKLAMGTVGEQEAQILPNAGLTMEQFSLYKELTSGTRRPYLILPTELDVQQEPDGLRFRFSLPSGSYATILLREFQKGLTIAEPQLGERPA